jgi:hypothetical protein
MVEGDSDLFSVDSSTGAVTTLRGLDFEDQTTHKIVVGTQEAEDAGESPSHVKSVSTNYVCSLT